MSKIDELKQWRDIILSLRDKLEPETIGITQFKADLLTWAISQIEQPASWYPDAQSVVTGDKTVQNDVQQAIELVENVGLFSIDCLVLPYPQKEHDTILRALRQMKPVPVGDYDGAIDELEENASEYSSWIDFYNGREDEMDVMSKDSYIKRKSACDLAIAALEYCKGRDGK